MHREEMLVIHELAQTLVQLGHPVPTHVEAMLLEHGLVLEY